MSSLEIPPWAWWVLGGVLLVCLSLDLFAHRHGRTDSHRREIAWTLGWITVALAFNAFVWRVMGREAAEEYLAAYLLEKSLSIDNLFVFLLIFGRLSVPHAYQRHVLSWGIFGALVTRGLFIFVGAAAVQRWHGVLYAFGAVLLFIGLRMLRPKSEEEEESKLLTFLERRLPYTRTMDSGRFFTRVGGKRVATTLLLALLAVEMTDVVFAVDSIPAAFAITTEPFIIYAANVFAVLGLRSLYLVLAGALSNLRYLHYGLSAVLCFAGGKMLTSHGFHPPSWVSLLVIVGCIGLAVVASLWARRGQAREARPSIRRGLRAKLGLGALVLVLLALGAAATLIVLTSLLHREVGRLGDASERIQHAEELQVHLLSYERASNLLALTLDPRHEAVRRQDRAAIEASLEEIQHGPNAARARAVAARIRHYFDARAAEEAEHTALSPMLRDVRAPLDAALAELDTLAAAEAAYAHQARAMAARWDVLGNVAGISGAAVLLIGVIGALWWTRKGVYLPLLQTRRAIADLSAGARNARAPEAGPTEIAEIARTFNQMAEQLEREREGRATFLAAVVHELRTPLSALKVANAAMARDKGDEAARGRRVGLMDRQIARLDRMLGDLLFAARAEAGRMELSFELREARLLVRECLELYRTYSDRHDFQLELPEAPLWLECDPVRIEQVLINLVSNAFKYSPDGGCVRVSLERRGPEALLTVRDEGIGLSAEEQARLFEPFRRVGALKERVSGVGLGLSVTRRLVEAHGGRIEVESASGQGSTFRVYLPAASPPTALDEDRGSRTGAIPLSRSH